MTKKLTRNTKDTMIAGVMSGLATYFDQDTALFRLIGAALFIFTVFLPFGLLYIAAWIILPVAVDHEPEYTIVD